MLHPFGVRNDKRNISLFTITIWVIARRAKPDEAISKTGCFFTSSARNDKRNISLFTITIWVIARRAKPDEAISITLFSKS